MELRIYEANGKWIVAGERFKLRFNTAQEAQAMANRADFINRCREELTRLLDVRTSIDELRREYQSLNYASTLTDADFVGENGDILKADLVAGITAAINVLNAITGATETSIYKAQR